MRITFLLVLVIISCVPNPKQIKGDKNTDGETPLKSGYSMIFFRIDDYVKIYADNTEIFDSRRTWVSGKEMLIDLNELGVSEKTQLKVECHNTECNDCRNNNWELVYELYKNGEGVEYVSEYSNNQHTDEGLAHTVVHDLSFYD
ncbi:hypothetical protein [Reichenbachiella versicolor]|uniref:hypothetical protein n=1 Tax=Reichenbachiella versicolor TaxID=1821036 RepID=UPI000D6E134B|nr:hypothetical protein [Reichenbachiella versicolor]